MPNISRIATLQAAGLSSDQIITVLAAEEAERAAVRREQNRINQQAHRARCQQKNADMEKPKQIQRSRQQKAAYVEKPEEIQRPRQHKAADIEKTEQIQRGCQQKNADNALSLKTNLLSSSEKEKQTSSESVERGSGGEGVSKNMLTAQLEFVETMQAIRSNSGELTRTDATKPKRPRRQLTPPEAMVLTDEMRQFAFERGFESAAVKDMFDSMVDWARNKEPKGFLDVMARWRNWVKKERPAGRRGGYVDHTQRQFSILHARIERAKQREETSR